MARGAIINNWNKVAVDQTILYLVFCLLVLLVNVYLPVSDARRHKDQ